MKVYYQFMNWLVLKTIKGFSRFIVQEMLLYEKRQKFVTIFIVDINKNSTTVNEQWSDTVHKIAFIMHSHYINVLLSLCNQFITKQNLKQTFFNSSTNDY